MWVFLNNAFVSAVARRERPLELIVRARLEGDLERAFEPTAAAAGPVTVEHTPAADYPYRTTVPRELFARAVAQAAIEIDYDNFKGSVPADEQDRHDAYLSTWRVMRALQERREHPVRGESHDGRFVWDDDDEYGPPVVLDEEASRELAAASGRGWLDRDGGCSRCGSAYAICGGVLCRPARS